MTDSDKVVISRQAVGLFNDAVAKGVLISLAALADRTGRVSLSVSAFATSLGVGRQTVRTVIDKLLKHEMATKCVTKHLTDRPTTLILSNAALYNGKTVIEKPVKKPTDQPPRAKALPLPTEANPDSIYGFINPDFAEAFMDWLEYKEKQHKFKYKTERSLKAAYNELLRLSGNDPKKAMRIVEQSMSHGWKGLFELKENGTEQHFATNRMATCKDRRDKGLFLASEIVSKSDNLHSLYDGSGVLAHPC